MSASDFMSFLTQLIRSRFSRTSFISIVTSHFSMNWLRMSTIFTKYFSSFCSPQCFVRIVMSRKEYCLDRGLNFAYNFEIPWNNPFKSASSRLSVVCLHMLIKDLSANSWICSEENMSWLVSKSIVFVNSMNFPTWSYEQISSFSVMLWTVEKIFLRHESLYPALEESRCFSIKKNSTLDLSFINCWYSMNLEIEYRKVMIHSSSST